MSSITNIFRDGVKLLNTPFVKEGVKNIAGTLTCAFGLVEIYDLYQIFRGKEVSTDVDPSASKFTQAVHKAIIIAAKLSLILSACVSRPGVYLISTLTGQFVSTAQLERVFGPNTIFAINPCHPRHVVSIIAVGLALPAVILSIYKGIRWTCEKVTGSQKSAVVAPTSQTTFTNGKIEGMNLFNFWTSRPTLHIGNWLAGLILRRA